MPVVPVPAFTDTTLMRALILLLSLLSPLSSWAVGVEIRFIDPVQQTLVPVRVELLNGEGQAVIADNALPLSQDCVLAPLPDWLAQPAPTSLFDPQAGTAHHYVDGLGRYDLQPGRYSLRAFKGPGYHIAELDFSIEEDSQQLEVALSRWSHIRDRGWVASDVHLHIPRRSPAADETLATWMAAEDLQIANLLQMGGPTHFAATPQYAFGNRGAYRAPQVLLLAGQEHPRTHLLGHALSLGAAQAVDSRATYSVYNDTFAAIRRAGGISGFAHWGAGPAKLGLALNIGAGNVELLEILSFEVLYLDTWYQLLNLGFPLAAVAGTDFPCLPGVPGRERTYLKLEGPMTRTTMVNALRGGRTFVSNGPTLEFSVENAPIGATLQLQAPRTITVSATLRHDPQQDDLDQLELIHDGHVIQAWPVDAPVMQLQTTVRAEHSGWLALRVMGRKANVTPPTGPAFPAWMQSAFDHWISGGGGPEIDPLLTQRTSRGSYAHSSPIYLALSQSGPRQDQAVIWIERLTQLENLLRADTLETLTIWDWLPYSDGIGSDHLRANAPRLLAQIRAAKAAFASQVTAE